MMNDHDQGANHQLMPMGKRTVLPRRLTSKKLAPGPFSTESSLLVDSHEPPGSCAVFGFSGPSRSTQLQVAAQNTRPTRLSILGQARIRSTYTMFSLPFLVLTPPKKGMAIHCAPTTDASRTMAQEARRPCAADISAPRKALKLRLSVSPGTGAAGVAAQDMVAAVTNGPAAGIATTSAAGRRMRRYGGTENQRRWAHDSSWSFCDI